MIHTITITIDTDDGKLTKRPEMSCAIDAEAEVSMETKRLIGRAIGAVKGFINDLYPETPEEAEKKELTRQIATDCLEAKRDEQGPDVNFITEDELRDFVTKNASKYRLIPAN